MDPSAIRTHRRLEVQEGQTQILSMRTGSAGFSSRPSLGLKYGIDANTVGMWDSNAEEYVALNEQPNVPNDVTGSFKYIAAGPDGSLYVIFEETVSLENPRQYVVIGTPPIAWGFWSMSSSPRRSLNLGSNGRWITCK